MNIRATISAQGGIYDGKAPDMVRNELIAVMHEATQYLERQIKKETPVGVYGARGGLLSSIHGEVVEKGAAIIRGVVATQSVYGEVIERGRRPGKAWPPKGSLLRWIELKMGVDEKEAKRIEFAIRAKIGKKGFPGKQMFKKTWDREFPAIQRMFERAGFDIARKVNG